MLTVLDMTTAGTAGTTTNMMMKMKMKMNTMVLWMEVERSVM